MEKISNSIAHHNRSISSFEDELGANADKVIPRMDDAGDDIPYQKPEYQINLPQAGLTRKNVPVRIINPFDENGKEIVQVSAEVILETDVPALRRGIHMSRTGDIIAETTMRVYKCLQDYASDLAERLNKTQYGGPSSARVVAPFSYLEDVPGWKEEKNKKSLETVKLSAYALEEKDSHTQNAGIEISNITACPCVQQTYKHALLEAKGDIREAISKITPLLTHSQRCNTQVEIKNITDTFPIREVIQILDQTVVRIQNTLPRDHELLMVYRAHKNPQFMEDVVRQVLVDMYNVFKNKYSESSLRVNTVSMESIHDFDIHANLEFSVRELQKMLGINNIITINK